MFTLVESLVSIIGSASVRRNRQVLHRDALLLRQIVQG